MKYILLIILSLVLNACAAQSKIKTNNVESFIYKVTKKEYGKKWAHRINEWRSFCYSTHKINECDTVYLYMEQILWESYYGELIQIGDSLLGFSVNIQTGELNCRIDNDLVLLCNIFSNRDEMKVKKNILSKEEGENILDLSPINRIVAIKNDDGYYYKSELIYFMSDE